MTETVSPQAYARYTRFAILMHWVIAALILAQLTLGFVMVDALGSADDAWKRWGFEQTQLHKSIGLTILGLSVLRLAWRILHPAPPLPPGRPWFERAGAHLSHWGFYGLMIGLPMTGWAMSSTSVEFGSLKTFYFGLFAVPHIPVISDLPNESKAVLSGAMKLSHWLLAIGACALLVLHVAAALKHHLIDRDAVLARMVPGVSPRDGRPLQRPLSAWSAGRVLGALALLVGFGGATAALYIDEERKAVAAAEKPAAELVADAPPAAPAGASRWSVVAAESRIGFSGENSGAAFSGTFKSWSAEIAFDPEALDEARVRAVIAVASARTGDAQQDATLPEKDWFDADAHPKAVFEATGFKKGDGPDGYLAEGQLTMRGVTKPITLPFTLSIKGDRAEMTGKTVIDRLAYGIGAAADGTGDWVSKDIPLEIALVATRGGAAGGPVADADATKTAPAWKAIPSESAIAFSGTNSGARFEGAFKSWAAEIRFDPDALDRSSVVVTVQVASARTGDAQQDATLLEKDWFDAAGHPKAVFAAKGFAKGEGEGAYVADGALTLRGETLPVRLPFQLSIEGDRATMTGETVIDRLAFGIGVAADATGDWVSKEIPLRISVTAVRTGNGG